MKKFRNNTRGQFVVAGALIIAALTLSVAFSIHQTNLHRQQLRYKPVEELVLGITSDLERALTKALSEASIQYYETRSEENATSTGYGFISKWVRSILASHSLLGIKININKTEVGLTDVSWLLDWSREVGISQVYTKFDLDIDAYGFKGWVGHSSKFVMLTIFPESIQLSNESTTLKFQIMQGTDQAIPIPNLTPESLKIWVNVTKASSVLVDTNITLNYLGGGNYTLTFPLLARYGMMMTVITPEDGIYVSARYLNDVRIFVTLQSKEENLASQNLGKIQLGETIFELPNSISADLGAYLLRYTPENASYTFLNWTTVGYINVADPSSSITGVTVTGNGTITAFYERSNAVTFSLILDSREQNNLTRSLGSITLGSTGYTLPANIVDLAAGNYTLQYELDNASYAFLRWEFSGGALPVNGSGNPTTLVVVGNGTVTAVYGSEPPITRPVYVSLRSLEETLAPPGNLGEIQLGETLFGLPSSTVVPNGTYLLRYATAEGYTFLNWTANGGISVGDPYSYATSVAVDGNGTITAFYRGCELFLDSRHWANSSFSLGDMTLGTSTYTLPKDLKGLARGDYLLQYTPPNSSYVFLWWEFSGDVIPWNSTSGATTLTIYDDGNVTAVYGLISEPPPPFVGDWSTLYVDSGYRLMPPFMWSGKSSHLPSWSSTGKDKQMSICESPPTPTIYLASLVNITCYLRINPPENAKDVTLELGFNYGGNYYKLGVGTFPINSEGVYRLPIDILYGEFPEGYFGVIPEGSVIVLTSTVTFFRQPWGTFMLFYGPKNPSRIELF